MFDDLLEQQRQRFSGGTPVSLAEPPPRTDGWQLPPQPMAAPQPLDWNYIFNQALIEARSQDPAFAASYAQLSSDAKEELKLAVLEPAESGIALENLDFDAMSRAFVESSFVAKVEGTTFSAWRDGELLIQLDHIDTAAENATATGAQMASVVIECIFLVIAIFVWIPQSTATLNRAVRAIVDVVDQSPLYRQAINALQAAWGQGPWAMAKAILNVIIQSNIAGVIGQVLRIILDEVAWYQYALMFLQILAYLAATILSGGAAAIAKIAAVVIQAASFILKVTNLQAIQALAPASA
ncbi:MAG TPA: hypothetical protein VMV07_13515 [Streptosporangiaceae bacterium]|nr:hypothetical protein [Streptosporangiaceae bacterium]